MAVTPSIRPLRDADVPDVVALVARTIDASYAAHYGPEALAFFKRYHASGEVIREAGDGATVVVEDDGHVAGTGTIVDGHVKRVFIDPACQGMGIGTTIMDHLERLARDTGRETVALDASLPAKRFYDRRGYQVVEPAFVMVRDGEIVAENEDTDLPGAERLDYFRMTKRLA